MLSYGEAWWFLRRDAVPFRQAITALRQAGLNVRDPATDLPDVLTDDGQRVPWNEADVQGRLAASETVTVQFWVNAETDVLVELLSERGLVAFDLDGMTTAEARFTVFAVLNAALALSGTHAVFVDKDLPDVGDDLTNMVTDGLDVNQLSFTPDLMASAEGDGHYSVLIRAGSWLSKPTETVHSLR